MIDPSDIQLDKSSAPSPAALPPGRRGPIVWLVGAGVLLVAGVALWFLLGDRGEQQATRRADDPAAALFVPAHGSTAICPAVEGLPLPRLDETDTFAGALASTLSAHPRVVAWLATDDVIRRVVTVVDAVATGKSPAPYLGPLRPGGTFRTIQRSNRLLVDPRNEARFAPMAEAIASVDVAAAARVCSALRTRLDDAYTELRRGDTFELALERALVSLLQTPVVGADAALVPNGARFAFEDPALEALTPAQKHLIRMGPGQTRAVQDKLREIAVAIGIPADRLPK